MQSVSLKREAAFNLYKEHRKIGGVTQIMYTLHLTMGMYMQVHVISLSILMINLLNFSLLNQ